MHANTHRKIEQTHTDSYTSFLVKAQVAQRAQVSIRTVDLWIAQKKIPIVKIGRSARFHWPSVEAALLKLQREAIK